MLKKLSLTIPALRKLHEERNRYAEELHNANIEIENLKLRLQLSSFPANAQTQEDQLDSASMSSWSASTQSPIDNTYIGKVRKPVFIVGCGRSGTTLLFDLLTQHPSFARTTGYPDGEDHQGWVEHGHSVMAGIGNIYHPKYGTGVTGYPFCLHMTREDATPFAVNGMQRHYWENVLQQDEQKRVLNKCPHNSNKIDYMLSIFPDAKIVHIIRDCQPMVASWLAVMDDHPSLVVYWPEEEFPCLWLMPKPDDDEALARLARHERFFPGGGAKLWIDYWCKTNSGIERQMHNRLSQLLVVRYEDLIDKPAKVLGRITEFCELPRYDYVVDHIEKNTAQKHLRLMSLELMSAIDVQSKHLRSQFGYEFADGNFSATSQPSQLYIP